MTYRSMILMLAGVATTLAVPLGLLLLVLIIGAAGAPAVGAAGTAKSVLKSGTVPDQYRTWVIRAGNECPAVSAPQIAAQIQQESNWNPDPPASPAGAEGIAQFLSDTWLRYGEKDAPGPVSPLNPYDAIMAMGRYDCAIAAQVANVPGDPLSNMLAGYDAGPGKVLADGGVPPIPETTRYVAEIEASIPQFAAATSALASGPFALAEIAAAEQFLGPVHPTPYVWGGGDFHGPTNAGVPGGPVGFDCSGLVRYAVYQASGGQIRLPRTSEQQATAGTPVAPSQLAPGDAIAIQIEPGDYSHIVIYLGGGMVIQAPQTGRDVDVVPLSDFSHYRWAIRWYGP